MRIISAEQAMKLIQHNEDQARNVGYGIRNDSRKDMRRRRGIFGLALSAAASMSVIALYQMGIFKHVPEPPGSRFDSGAVTGSAKAYSLLETPDSVLAIGSYAVTMALAAMGSPDRAREQPLLPILLAAKVAFDAAVAAKYTIEEWKGHRVFCFWCLLASATTFASLPLAILDARHSIQNSVLPEA
jgi:hypothetical protein